MRSERIFLPSKYVYRVGRGEAGKKRTLKIGSASCQKLCTVNSLNGAVTNWKIEYFVECWFRFQHVNYIIIHSIGRFFLRQALLEPVTVGFGRRTAHLRYVCHKELCIFISWNLASDSSWNSIWVNKTDSPLTALHLNCAAFLSHKFA